MVQVTSGQFQLRVRMEDDLSAMALERFSRVSVRHHVSLAADGLSGGPQVCRENRLDSHSSSPATQMAPNTKLGDAPDSSNSLSGMKMLA